MQLKIHKTCYNWTQITLPVTYVCNFYVADMRNDLNSSDGEDIFLGLARCRSCKNLKGKVWFPSKEQKYEIPVLGIQCLGHIAWG